LRFIGQWEDEETGLHYNLNRFYDPESGCYLSSDPIGLTGGLRIYGYVDNPNHWVDPLGLAGCPPKKGFIEYGERDSLGRPTGTNARITKDMIGTGTSANPSIRPPGFEGGATGQARGHLLGRQLGGSGDVPENLVTLQQNPTNSPFMSGYEGQIRAAVDRGETIDYSSTPIYHGDNLVPQGVTMTATGDKGFNLAVTVLNPPGR
jgi:RHS repeat-associated protein